MSYLGQSPKEQLFKQDMVTDSFSGNGSTVAFTLSVIPSSVTSIETSIFGVMQRPTIDYTLSGAILTFGTAPPAGTNNILVRTLNYQNQTYFPKANTITSAMLQQPLTLDGPLLGTPASGNFSTGTFTWPTFNQSTTGSAATLTTSRNINGVGFNGSANITVTADATTLTGTSLNATVVGSSLTSVGTLSSLLVSGNTGLGGVSPSYLLHLERSSSTGTLREFLRLKNTSTAAASSVWLSLYAGTTAPNPMQVAKYAGEYTGSVSYAGFGEISDGDSGIQLSAYNASGVIRFLTGGSTVATNTRMTIDSSGNLGLGISPSYKLHVKNTALTSTAAFANIVTNVGSNASGADVTLLLTDSTLYNYFISGTGGILGFSTNGTTKQLMIDTSGNVGIGTPSTGPLAKLDVIDQNNAGVRFEQNNNSDGVVIRCYRSLGTTAAKTGVTNGTNIWSIRGAGYNSGGTYAVMSSAIQSFAAETFTTTANGSYINFYTTSLTTTTLTNRLTIEANGNFTIPAYSLIKMVTGNAQGRILNTYALSSTVHDYLVFSVNYDRSAGTIDSASLGTVALEIIGTNGGSGGFSFKAGAVNTAPTQRFFIDNTGVTVGGPAASGGSGKVYFTRNSDGASAGAIGFLTTTDSTIVDMSSIGGSGVLTFTTSTSEKMRIGTNGNTCIGYATTPGAKLLAYTATVTQYPLHAQTAMTGLTAGSTSNFAFFGNGRGGIDTYADGLRFYAYRHTTAADTGVWNNEDLCIERNVDGGTYQASLRFGAGYIWMGCGGSERARVDSSGNLTIANGNLIVGTAGKGIDFSATANATGSPAPGSINEVFADFEMGSWTPDIAGVTTAGATTGLSGSGWYQRTGNTVFVTATVGWTSHTGTGVMKIINLPFVVATGSQYYSTGTLDYSNLAVSASSIGYVQAAQGINAVYCNQVTAGAVTTTGIQVDAGGAILYFSLTYVTNT